MKYAIVEHGGKQYLAEEGQSIEVDRLRLEAGKPIEFGEVLLVADGGKVAVGQPYLQGVKVKGKVESHLKGEKLVVFKYRPKQRYRRKSGHRQAYTRITIESIGAPSGAPTEKAAESVAPGDTQKKASKPSPAGKAKAPAKSQAKPKSQAAKKAKAGSKKAPPKSKSKPGAKSGAKPKATAKPKDKPKSKSPGKSGPAKKGAASSKGAGPKKKSTGSRSAPSKKKS